MRIWATLDDYLPPGKHTTLVGRNIANFNFLHALFKYSSFDTFHFFLTNKAHQKYFLKQHSEQLQPLLDAKRVQLFTRYNLPQEIAKTNYTIFHLSDHLASFQPLCYLRNRLGTFPITAFIHSLSYQSFMEKYLIYCFGGFTANDVLLCSSPAGKQVVENCFTQINQYTGLATPPMRLEVFPFGLDIEPQKIPSKQSSRATLGLPQEQIVGLCFARFSEYDKMDLVPLLHAFHAVAQKAEHWKLILAGSAQSPDYIRILEDWVQILKLQKHVVIMQTPSPETKSALYAAADFFISVSDNPQETFGISLLEAMAYGLPLLVADYDGYKNIVHESFGRKVRTLWKRLDYLVELAPLLNEADYHRLLAQSLCIDLEDLRKKLQEFYQSSNLRQSLGTAASKEFMQKYAYRNLIPQLENLWQALQQNYRPAEKNSLNPCAMDVFTCFAHYPTDWLNENTPLQTSLLGQAVLTSEAEYPLLPEMDIAIAQQTVRQILQQLKNPQSLAQLQKNDEKSLHLSYLIMWMLKQGLISEKK